MRLVRGLFIVLGLLLMSLVISAPANSQGTAKVVISQVYGGGGNSTATVRNDFIELFNAGTASASLSGWSVQYASAAGALFQMTNLTAVTLQPGQYYLVQQAAGADTTLPVLPTPDASGTIPMSGTSGVVALVTAQIPLVGCGISCYMAPNVIDLVGYGATANVETLAAPGLTNSTAAIRRGNGCQDTNNNSADFVSGTATPRNTASLLYDCANPPTITPTPAVSFTPSATFTPAAGTTRIHDIQGFGHISPIVGQLVTNVPGIVTSIYYVTSSGVTTPSGFYMQDPTPDADLNTSEGILVFTGSTPPTVVVGDGVFVTGRVTEYRPATANLSITEIGGTVAVSIVSHGNTLPAPVPLNGPNMVISNGNAEAGPLDPSTEGIDYYEIREGMRVAVNNPVVVGPTTNNGEITVLPENGADASVRTPRGGIIIRPNDFNPERIVLDDEIFKGLLIPMPSMNVMDTVSGAVVGILDYSFGDFKLEVTQAFTPISGGLTQEVTTLGASANLRVATFNVENLNPLDPPSKFAALGSQIVTNLASPDVIVIEEIQDNNGTTNNGNVDAVQTWDALINAIVTAGGPTYQYRQIDPVDGQDGGAGGGNIRQGFLFNPARVTFVDRTGGTSTTANSVSCVAGEAQLQYSPGRLDPSNSAWNASRKPLAGEFLFNGHRLIVIGNHFNSKGGDYPLFGPIQPPLLLSEPQRLAQATVVHDFVNQTVTCEPDANVIVLGDLNDFEFSAPIQTLKGTILDNLVDTLPATERYGYVYTGNSQVLDQILVSHNLTNTAAPQYDIVHINAEFFHSVLPGSVRTSDHDPSIVALNPPLLTPTNTPTATATPTSTDTPTETPTSTPTDTATFTPTNTPTDTATFTDTPTDTATFTSTPSVSFYRAINLGGPATVIDGNLWEANTGTTPNFQTNGSTMCNPYQPPIPATDPARASMIQCYREHWALNMRMNNVPTGTYLVYLYVWQNWNNPQDQIYDVTVEGQTVVSNYHSGTVAGVWAKLGPFITAVNDGVLNVTTTGPGLVDASGLEVYSISGGEFPTPVYTATRTNTPIGPTATRTASNTVTPSNTPGGVTATRTNTPTRTATNVPATPTPSRTATFTLTPGGTAGFFRAYNLNGPSLMIDGHTWTAGSSSDLDFTGTSNQCKQNVALIPATDANRAQMIRCYVTGNNPNVEITNVPNGFYDVYLYIWEDNTPSTFSISLQGGQIFVPNVNSGAAGSWQRMGPYTVNVTGGWMSIDSSGGAANFSGIELYRR